jgi:sporulation protein YhbH
MTVDDIQFNDIRKRGMMSNVDKRRTLIQSLKRRSLSGSALSGDGMINSEDLRFKTWEEIQKPQSSAVVLAMMDTSGSMSTFEKYISRSFFFWMVRFLRNKYENVKIRFLSHHTEAQEVNEEAFFTKGESGGTRCSSVYELALRLVEQDHPAQLYNIYAFHFSDGDNLDSDNALTIKLATELADRTNLFGYGEIRQYQYHGKQLWDAMSAVRHPAFITSVLREKGDVHRTLKAFFGDSMVT